MNAIVGNVLVHEAGKAKVDSGGFTIVLFFCAIGLLASLCKASLGFDISTGAL
jgi:hypothetical protein